MKIHRVGFWLIGCVVASYSVLGSRPAFAQAYIGEIAGQMAANRADAAREAACRHGVPADPDTVKELNAKDEKLMDAYFRLNPKSTARDIAEVFDIDNPDVRWRDADGSVPMTQLAGHLGKPASQRSLVVSVTGGDAKTTRTIWSTTQNSKSVFYAVDFIHGSWLGGTHILHMAVLPGPTPPPTPPAYCHFDSSEHF